MTTTFEIATTRSKGSERVRRLREKVRCQPSICIERAYLMTESYKETEGEPAVIRRAKALEKILREIPISIDDEELIVGRATTKQRAATLIPETNWKWYLQELDLLSTRDCDQFAPFTEEEKTRLKDFLPYWEGKSLYDKWRGLLSETAVNKFSKLGAPNAATINPHHRSHNAVDYNKVLNGGLVGVKKEVDEALAKLDVTDINYLDRSLFLKAVNITLGAVSMFARRYAGLARSLAKNETDSSRKAELERIAAICDWVPTNPARSFHEALQSVWFTFVALMIEGWGPSVAFGRADQYLYPFYKKDIDDGRLSKEEALELIELLYIKIHGLVTVLPTEIVKDQAGFQMILNIVLGGVTPAGKDAVNELSYLFLDADEIVNLSSPEIVIRINQHTPDTFLMRACEALKSLNGKYKFISDGTAIQQLLTDGKPVEYARDYIVGGCWALTVPGRSDDLPGPRLNLALMVELALNNGVSRLTGERMGPETGDPRTFKSYAEVWDAYKRQVEAQIPGLIYNRNTARRLFADFTPLPLQSALFHGCIEKGIDITNGGTAPYITQALGAAGSPNAGDSLAAIKKVVFDDKQITMDRLIDALDKNFQGEEAILHLLKSAPKFGNDDDYVDSIVNEVLVHFSNEAARYKGLAGAVTSTSAATGLSNVKMGHVVGATPDGRKAEEAIAEGGISPYQGRNVSGPTATMRSVAKLDHLKLTNGSVLNMRFNPDALKDEAKMRKFVSLLRTYCETGGYLVQFNITSTDTLRAAQKNPEQYQDLLVRVATYSARFVELGAERQDDIIARMEFQEI